MSVPDPNIGVVCSRGVGPERGGRSFHHDNFLFAENGRWCWLENEKEVVSSSRFSGTMLAVIDGMGGEAEGTLAALATVRILMRFFREDQTPKLNFIVSSVHRAHGILHQRSVSKKSPRLGSSFVVLWKGPERMVHWLGVGDATILRVNHGGYLKVNRHQTINEFAIRDRRKQLPDGERLAQAFIYGSRGWNDDQRIRLEEELDYGTFVPDPEERVVLYTDGVSRWVDDASVADVVQNTPKPQAAATALVERAMARGSVDNVTSLVWRYAP